MGWECLFIVWFFVGIEVDDFGILIFFYLEFVIIFWRINCGRVVKVR